MGDRDRPAPRPLFAGEQESRMGKKMALADAAALFNLLGDRTRLRILQLLSRRGEMSVSELCEAVGIRSVGVGYHLVKLRLHGVIDGRRRGQRRSYTLGAGLVHDLLCFVKPERPPHRAGSAMDGTGRGRRTGAAGPQRAARRL
jgi:ArsR family transcriptional regulator